MEGFLRALANLLVSWGPPGLFVLALLDSAGIPLPATVDALVMTLAALRPAMAVLGATLAVIGSTAGCMILFYLARKGGELYLDKQTQTGRARKFRDWFLRYGLVTVFIPALLPIPLPTKVFVISAGAFGVPWPSFLLVVLAARIPRYFGLAWLGSQLGEYSWVWLKAHVWHLMGVAIVLFGLSILLLKIAGRSRQVSTGMR
ncbi:MAG: VTT domain-containing protein [Bryobacteraceae bacterium]